MATITVEINGDDLTHSQVDEIVSRIYDFMEDSLGSYEGLTCDLEVVE